MRKRALKSTLLPEAHTWQRVIPASTRFQVVNLLTALFQSGEIKAFRIRSLSEMTGNENRTPATHVLVRPEDVVKYVEREARLLDQFDHYEIVVHESKRVPDLGPSAVHPSLATVVCEYPDETLSLTG